MSKLISIESLSDKEFFTIFNSLPLRDLMQVRRVCRRWQFIHEIVCRSKTELSLYHPSYRHDVAELHSLWYWSNSTFVGNFKDTAFCIKSEYLVRKRCQQLIKLFPNVRRLNIFGLQLRANHFARMMKHWSKMEQLTLAFHHHLSYEWKLTEWKLFWKALNSLKSLKHLALPYECGSFKSLYPVVLSRLESLFVIIGYDEDCRVATELFHNIPPSLKRLHLADLDGDGAVFEEGLSNYFNLDEKLRSLLQNKPQVFTQLVHLGWSFEACSGVDLPLLNFICRQFTSLVSLDLNIDYSLQLCHMLPLLANLKHLVSLRISPASEEEIDFEDEDSTYEESIAGDFEFNITEEAYPAEYDYHYKDYRSHGFFVGLTPKTHGEKLIKLDHIQRLHLANFDFFRWEQFDYLRAAFPNIVELHFENCEFYLKRKNSSRRKKRKCRLNRMQILLRVLKRFTKLKRIYRNGGLLLEMSTAVASLEAEKKAADGVVKELFKRKKRIDFEDTTTDCSYDTDDGFDSDLNYYIDSHYDDLAFWEGHEGFFWID